MEGESGVEALGTESGYTGRGVPLSWQVRSEVLSTW